MSTSHPLQASLLRLPVLHILRAAGFHSTRPSVLDTLVNITERYLLLLATTTAHYALTNHNGVTPTTTDVRMALTDCGVLGPVLQASEEEWKEILRRNLTCYGDGGQEAALKELRRRGEEDTEDVREFVRWIVGEQNREIRRVAGMLGDEGVGPGGERIAKEDYLTILKKKHSKTGEESRYQGTILGKFTDDRRVRIEGGPAESIQEWTNGLRERAINVPTDDASPDLKDTLQVDAPIREAVGKSPSASKGDSPVALEKTSAQDAELVV
ncbi:hypothetical protein LTR66_005950 [Elasticomyces elasticus]|nr:hypothetical protein LTR50_004195 [Elasticomyces elasticus]KAK4993725.1 hypothetical protein LTR66_005950 [Elasticomyces elasticus]